MSAITFAELDCGRALSADPERECGNLAAPTYDIQALPHRAGHVAPKRLVTLPKSQVTLRRRHRSRSTEMSGHLRRNTHFKFGRVDDT